MFKLISFILFILLLPGVAIAQTQQVTTTAKTPSDFKISGYVDGSYNYLQNSNKFTSGTYNRVFDTNPNGITLQQAGITMAYQPQQGFGGLITPVEGRDPIIFAPYGWFPNNTTQTFGIAVPQAFLQYAVDSLTFMGGNFIELAGAENIFSYNDTNFSRSILWGYAEPFTVTGLRVSYDANDKFKLIGGINNGWDSIRDTSRQKTIELGASYTFNPMFSLAAYGYSGQQRIADRTSSGPTGQRTLIDLIATLNATEKLSFVVNYDGALQTKAALPSGNIAKAVWQGVAGYINYQFNDKWRTSFRGELFNDRDGYRTGVAQRWDEITLTVGYALLKNFELRAETRRDFSNVSSFINKNGVSTSNNQQSYAIEAIAKFS
ncbi:outer membrane beta-barrel protein [Legionella maioricensis]|uniref:Porin n=1 Tax=Legionella maioricensis TaxID=2896528 RepID=A0A9X2D2Y0_9GAMM|nr:outer membrane beta-barrel protein [Legionella maioricensis]MCL9685349.1 porin [Legionella maioricensis]MCL9688689.1 porin [Legionella maioricensis]